MIFGEELFTEETPRLAADPILPFVLIGISLLEFALGIWGIFLLCNTIAEVQGFKSAWKGLGNLLLAGLIIVVPLFFIIFAVLLVVAAG